MHRIITQSLLATLVLCFLGGCAKSCDKAAPQDSLPPAGLAGTGEREGSINLSHPPVSANHPADAGRPVIKGKIVEAIYKEGFAYVRLEMGEDSSMWVAIVNQKPTVGQTISVQEQAVLSDFHSKSLDRTFSKIVFGSIVE